MISQSWPNVVSLLGEIADLAEKLRQQLDHEGELLKSAAQIELLEQSTAVKQDLIVRLDGLNRQFGQVLETENFPLTPEGVKAFFDAAESSGFTTTDVLSLWQQIQAVCLECRTLNEHNGASIELLAQHANRSLDILKGKPQTSGLYGRDGVAKNDNLKRTLTLYL